MSSLFGKMFGSGGGGGGRPAPTNKTQNTAAAIQKIQEAAQLLEKKSDYMEKKIQAELKAAKACGTKNKQQALQHLKRKARYQKQADQLRGQIQTLETQQFALENMASTTEVLGALETGHNAMKANMQDVDKVQDLVDDVQEQMEMVNEVSDAISNPAAFGQQFDDDDLLAELEDLEQEELDQQLLDVGTPGVELPSVPDALPTPTATAAVKEDEDELADLAAWAT